MRTDRRPGPSTRVRVHEVVDADGGPSVRRHEDRLATEEPLEIRLEWPGEAPRRVAVTMRTPGHDFELATGFLHGEGVLRSADDLRKVAYCTDVTLSPEQEFNVVTVELARPPRRPLAERYAGLSAASSACGVCGTESIDDVLALTGLTGSGRWADLAVPSDVLLRVPDRLRAEQRVFDSTGGLHAAGLFDEQGEPFVVREDIGRHNAVDKVVGARVLAGASPAAPVLGVSGRIGFEIVQKAVVADVGVVAAVGAPSSLAVDLAVRAGLCTAGFVKAGRFVLYSEPERVAVASPHGVG
ncbi:MAG: formate dehydrogenase accessory sulfurtransferase FdhD [Nocardioidaceae bacterium]|nr:formate dehydrogenase accessory sulfurtransferase FdhD [Nocardioidaceae bacterium]NUS51430.1 formate dehydrogenase accessory sulfurtransferase FdhD [Nocardioidaceae bacterium]